MRSALNPRRTHQSPAKRQLRRKIISFQLGLEWYALPIEQVQRILDEFTPHGSLQKGRGLVRLEDQALTWVDPACLFPGNSEDRNRTYLMVCSLAEGRSVGIPVPQLPKVFEVVEDQIQPVPDLYQQSGSPAGIKGIIHLNEHQVFLLDLEQLLSSRLFGVEQL